jgi:NAD(P)-dependent dehydrogenase (short-subunit alcohol dehydrogenase family)
MNDSRDAGPVVLVTGAGQGIGAAIASCAAAAGARVAVTARKLAAADAVAVAIVDRGDDAVAIRCDVGSRADIDAALAATVARWGRLDGLVHNAVSSFSSRPVPFEDVDDENWDDQISVALRAAFHLAQAGFESLRAAGGTLVLLLSTAGMEGSRPVPAYSSIKGAQRAFVKSLAREWGPAGVRVNGLAPVAVTPAIANFFAHQPEAADRMSARAALGRLGDPELDIGPAVNFLLGPDSRYITGQTLVVDGGAFMF